MQKTEGLLRGYRLTSTTSWDKFGHLLLLLVYALLRMSRTCLVPFWRQRRKRLGCSSPMNLGFDSDLPRKLLRDNKMPGGRLLRFHITSQ